MATTTKQTTKGKTTKADAKAQPVNDDAAKVAELLKKLGAESSPLVKKRLRRQLRSLGHAGGLGKRKANDGK